MAGLSLGVGGYGSAAGYTPAASPVASNQPEGATINQQAFGIGTSQTSSGPSTAGFGTVGLGLAGALVLTWLWWTLPR
ncbi:MAG: hypothetical protein WAM97_04770 [Acidimicrobiales bacterium]|jgi:hypothetical protein